MDAAVVCLRGEEFAVLIASGRSSGRRLRCNELAVDTPVEGRIVFTKRAKFPKGLPRFTVMLESVAAEFPRLGAAELDIAVAKYRPGWQRLKEAARPSPHFRANPVAVA